LKEVEETLFTKLNKYRFKSRYITHVRGQPEWFKVRVSILKKAFRDVQKDNSDRLELIYPSEYEPLHLKY
jgi:hypothetical protein